MPLPSDLISSLEFVQPRELIDLALNGNLPTGGGLIKLRNEVLPADLFCYLGAKFGKPNGIQSLLKNDDSDNLFHWQWTLRHKLGFVSFTGANFRTEVLLNGAFEPSEDDKLDLAKQIKSDFAAHGKEMGTVRKALENWVEFVNPYQRLKRSIDTLVIELDSLDLQPEHENVDDFWETKQLDDAARKWDEMASRYSKGVGLCFGIRSMLPVLAEAYVNLLIFILMRPEMRKDQRLRDSAFRQQIDIRIRSLAINCDGFEIQPDFSSDACKQYHSLVNERNDLLHGNVTIDKLKFNEVYFLGKMPIFKSYRTMWQRSLEITQNAVGLKDVRNESAIVDNLVAYLRSCLREDIRKQVDLITDRYELGFNEVTQRMGILFPNVLVDFRCERNSEVGQAVPDDVV